MQRLFKQRFLESLITGLGSFCLVCSVATTAQAGGVINDECALAIPVVVGTTVSGATNTGATNSAADTCTTSNTSPDVWYSFVGTGGPVTVSTCGAASFDTKLSVFSGACGALTCVLGNDDTSGCAGNTSRVSLATTVLGTDYFVLVHGFQQATGTFDLTISGPPPAPANDLCVSATPVAVPSVTPGTTVGATADPESNAITTCGTSNGAPGVWYTFEGTGAQVVVSLCGGPSFDSKLRVYTGDCAGFTCVGGNDDFCGGLSQVTVATTVPGTIYTVHVYGFGSNTGAFELVLSGPPPVPANDLCADAAPIAIPSVTPGTTVGATADPESNAITTCGTSNGAPGVWYTFEGTGTDVELSLCEGSSYDTKLRVYTGDCAGFVCVGGNDDACGTRSRLLVPATSPGTIYTVHVYGFSDRVGTFELAVSVPPPANDLCDDAIALTVGDSADGTTVAATFDDVGECGTSNTSPGVWYSFLGNGEEVLVSVCDAADFDTKLGVFTGACDALVCVDGNDDGAGCADFSSALTVLTELDVEYRVLVHGFQAQTGDFTLSILGTAPPPPNDVCVDAIEVAVPSTTAGTNVSSDDDAPADNCGLAIDGSTVWYSFPGIDGELIVSLCSDATDFDTKLHVFKDACEAPTCIASNDDACGLASEVTFAAGAGTVYHVAVSGFEGATGDFELTVTGPPPANDECEFAEALEPNSSTTGSTRFASIDKVPEACGTPVTAPGVWYSFSAPFAGKAFVFTCSELTTYDSKLTLFEVTDEGLVCIAGNDDACGVASGIAFIASAGANYKALVHGFNARTGDFELTYELYEPPANDACDGAEPVEPVDEVGENLVAIEVLGSTVPALDDTEPEDLACYDDSFGPEAIGGGVWYSIVGTGETMSVSTCEPDAETELATYDTQISVFRGECGALECVAFNDDGEGCVEATSFVEWESEAGVVYLVLVHGFSGAFGDFAATFTAELPPGGLQLPGDMNQDGRLDISDGVALFGHLFSGNPEFAPCGEGSIDDPSNLALLNFNGDARVDISDGIAELQYLFSGGSPHALGEECVRIPGCANVCVDEI